MTEAPAPAKTKEKKKELTKQERTERLRRAYSAADSRLRKAHQDEFNRYYSDEAAQRGVVWEPKPDAVTAARATILKLLGEHPGLADEFHLAVDGPEPPEDEVPG